MILQFYCLGTEKVRTGKETSEWIKALDDFLCIENFETLFEVAEHMVPEF
jgi:hypothetical protein